MTSNAGDFLKKVREGGAIVCSGECSEVEIANAQATNRWFVDEDGFGYVWRTGEWLDSREKAFHGVSQEMPPLVSQIEDEEAGEVESPATAIQRAFELHQVKVEPGDIDCMLLDGINALLEQQSDRIVGALKDHERRLGCHYSSEPADRVRSILRDYEERAARATQLLADMRSDTLTYLRAISLMIDSAGNAGTHREKDATLRAVIRLTESAIAKLRDSLKRFGSNWHNPDIFASDYPVMDYIKRIRELESENKALKGQNDTPLTPFDEIRF
ncbi:hypothetical protein [Pantanalinema sp. GBBB05]|uniref:hypothetical protein n=1 Tax=Pantanalinema sp. GBBB05 TaxID=2604139 RepID=UPI001D8DB573|nr:hypothetical protein [Pantanalinema sp. GBBB05]